MFKKIPIRCLANTVNLKDSKKGSRLHNFVFPDTSILHLNVLLHSNKNYVASHRTRLYTFVTESSPYLPQQSSKHKNYRYICAGGSEYPGSSLQNPGKAIWNYFFIGIGEITCPRKRNPEIVIN